MGTNDAAEQLEAAKAECIRLEQALRTIHIVTLETLLRDLKNSPIVTLAGRGGAFEFIEARIQKETTDD